MKKLDKVIKRIRRNIDIRKCDTKVRMADFLYDNAPAFLSKSIYGIYILLRDSIRKR